MTLEAFLIIVAMGVAAGLITQGIVVLKRRREGPPAAAAPAVPAARVLTCCGNPQWVAERDVGSARGFDMTLGKCGSCGTPWIDAWCTASSMGAYEPVKPADAQAMRAIKDPTQLHEFMRRWVEHIA